MKRKERRKIVRSHFTIKEVAQIWGVSANFVRRLIWDNELAHTRFGRAVRIPAHEVESYAQARTVDSLAG